jgi:uncharacterized protein
VITVVAITSLDLVQTNLTSPPVLAFVLGAFAALARSDMRLPAAASSLLSAYLLLAIGLKGGKELAAASPTELAWPLVATVAIGVVSPLVVFAVLRWRNRFSLVDAGGIAAHYGSVSAVTFTAAVGFVASAGYAAEGFLPALLAIMEIPGIVVPLVLVAYLGGRATIRSAVSEVLMGRSIVLLAGGTVIGLIGGASGYEQVAPFFDAPFKGVLTLFLLDLGAQAGLHLRSVRQVGGYLVALALLAPPIFGVIGAVAGTIAGLSVGGAAILAAMAASASYIAAPAAVGIALPEANPAYSLTAALAITFPFNLLIGIPLYLETARILA